MMIEMKGKGRWQYLILRGEMNGERRKNNNDVLV